MAQPCAPGSSSNGNGRPSSPCIGVPGNPAALDANYVTYFNYYGTPSAVSPCIGTSSADMPSVSQYGCCVDAKVNGARAACTNPLTIDGDTLEGGKFPCALVGLTKTWGVTSSWQHGGVVADNISIATNVPVTYKGKTNNQNVLRLRMTGDLINDPDAPPGVFHVHPPHSACKQQGCYGPDKTPTTPCNDQVCMEVKRLTKDNINASVKDGGAGYTYSNPQARVGACVATANQFGPGKYSVLARVPKTSWDATGGRGYVFAMWTFAYSENYNDYKSPPAGYGFGNNLAMHDSDPPTNVNGKTPPALPSSQQGSQNDGWFSIINHEIDIEIPANSPQLAGTWQDDLTWGTMNCNTWLSDIDVYSGTDPYYTQAMVSKESFISESGEFHLYEFEWYVNPDNPSESKVTWSFDGEEVYSTTRFVPFYAGRLVVGPWPGWWGSNKQSPQFDYVDVDIASISIVPQTNPQVTLAIGQMYDQALVKSGEGGKVVDLACGFQGWADCAGQGPCTTPAPPPPPDGSTKWYCDAKTGCHACPQIPGSANGCPSTVTTVYDSQGDCQAACPGSSPHGHPSSSNGTSSTSFWPKVKAWIHKHKGVAIGIGVGVLVLIAIIIIGVSVRKKKTYQSVQPIGVTTF